MNYAWEAMLQADRDDISRDDIRFVNAAIASPYVEISLENLNADFIEGRAVEINPLYRFGKELGTLFDGNIPWLEQTRQIFFDVCMHYITQLDLREGLSRQDFYLHLLERDFVQGRFGGKATMAVGLFTKCERKKWLASLLNLMHGGNYLYEFRKILKEIYPQFLLYENNDMAYELLVYLGAQETTAERGRIKFLIWLFLPIQYVVHIFYDHHFGIIGIDETMVLDEMVLF